MKRQSNRVNIGFVILHTLLLFGAFLSIFPILWMLATSFKPNPETLIWPPKFLPIEPTLENFVSVFRDWPFIRFFWNSFMFAGVSTFFIVLTSTMGGYAFAKIQFWGREILFFTFVATIILPLESYMIPLYLLVNRLGWLNSYAGLVLPFVIMSFGLFLMRQSMRAIPDELIDAARIDGYSEFGIFWHLVIPLTKGAVSALTIYAFLNVWGNFTWPLIITSTQDMYTTELGLAMFQKAFFIEYALIMAGAVVTSAPLIIVFLIFQKNIISGITLTGLKG